MTLLPFKRKMQPILWSDGRIQSECDDMVHLFSSVPGRCQCGERIWETDQVKGQPGVFISEKDQTQ